MLTPERQLALDDQYWHTSRTMKSIAADFAVPSHQLSKLVSPLPTGLDCWWCKAPVGFRTRSERANFQRPYGTLDCPCGAFQPHPQRSPRLEDSDATILVPDPLSAEIAPHARRDTRLRNMSHVVRAGVRALDECGLRWMGRFAVVDIGVHPSTTRHSLDLLEGRTVVVPSLRDLATNEGDSLALFFHLVADGWRIITTIPTRSNDHTWNGGHWYDEMVPMWSRSDEPPADVPTSERWTW